MTNRQLYWLQVKGLIKISVLQQRWEDELSSAYVCLHEHEIMCVHSGGMCMYAGTAVTLGVCARVCISCQCVDTGMTPHCVCVCV